MDQRRGQSPLHCHLAPQGTSFGPALYEDIYCARGDMENRIKECQADLFADRTPAATMRANQLRLWFASMAYVLICALRRVGLAGTELARATCGTLRLKLLKIGAQVTISVRRVKIALASSYPWQQMFSLAYARLDVPRPETARSAHPAITEEKTRPGKTAFRR